MTAFKHSTPLMGKGRKALAVTIALAQLTVLIAITFRWVQFGSEKGNWLFPHILPVSAALVLGGCLTGLAACVALRICARKDWLHTHEIATVLSTYAIGTILESIARRFYPLSLADLVLNDYCNGFYSAAMQTSAADLLKHFGVYPADVALHVRTNLPGKTLFFDLLLNVTSNPAVLGHLIVAISNISALLVYLLARQLFADRTTALWALVFTLVTPAKVYFQPILNVVSPVGILLALNLFVAALKSTQRSWTFGYALAFGSVAYLWFVFEPLPYALGLFFLAVGIYFVGRGKSAMKVLEFAGPALGGFAIAYGVFAAGLGFNLWRAFGTVLTDAVGFNARVDRNYATWIIHNLKEFAINAGAGSTSLMLFQLWLACRPSALPKLERVLVFAFAANLVVLDLLGVNRGEVTRLWIFLTPIQQLLVARGLALHGRLVYEVVLIGMIVQAFSLVNVVGYTGFSPGDGLLDHYVTFWPLEMP